MKDFKIVHARVLLNVFSIAPIRGFSPPSIVAIGDRLNTASEILYNGVEVTEFIVSSSSRLLIRIPLSQVGRDLIDLKVFSSRPTPKLDAALILEVSNPITTVSGIDRLVQNWVMIFLTTPGSDVFSPQSGGGARSIIGSGTDRKHKSASADLAVAIDRTGSELLKLQAKMHSIPPEEKLLSNSLDSISYDDSSGVLSARVSLKNMVNQSASVSLS